MSRRSRSGKPRERKCRECFQYNPVHLAVCARCGNNLPKTRAQLSFWEKVKRFFGLK